METRCTSSNRSMVIQVLENELHEKAVFHPAPEFLCTVGGYALQRDGILRTKEDSQGIFPILASLGLCDHPNIARYTSSSPFTYPTAPHSGKTLLNLFCIISARQLLMNKALAAAKAFYVMPSLMDSLIFHPPVTTADFLQILFWHENEYGGIRIDFENIEFTGFQMCRQEEAHIHHQISDLIIDASLSLDWVKPYTKNVRNRKYAFRIWLNSIGMIGPKYEEARHVMLDRLYGSSACRSIRR